MKVGEYPLKFFTPQFFLIKHLQPRSKERVKTCITANNSAVIINLQNNITV